MFEKKNRLTKQKDFDSVFKAGFSNFDKVVGVKVKGNNLENNRFGVIVGKKVNKKAVTRNKIKRRIREILKMHNCNIKQGYDIVVITLPLANEKNYSELNLILEKHLKKLKLFNV